VHVFSFSHTIPAGLAVRLQIATGTRAQQIDTLACLHEPSPNPRRLLAGVWEVFVELDSDEGGIL